MIRFLRVFFIIVLISMLAVTIWASSQVALWNMPSEVGGHPWFIATLFDTYWAFFTFYAWLFYREPSWLKRFIWFIAIVLLGNIAMAIYVLWLLSRLPKNANAADLLLRPVSERKSLQSLPS
jgi:predicted permease